MVLKLTFQTTRKKCLYALLFYLLLLQNPLESLFPVLKLTDEVVSLMGLTVLMIRVMICGTLRVKRISLAMAWAFVGFLAAGLAGNILWDYQPEKTVLTDLYTNMKFFLALITGTALLKEEKGSMAVHARISAAVLFVLLLADQFLGIFPAWEIRYGLRSSRLMYSHPTYLAGAAVFLLAVLTENYEKRNRVYIVMSLVLLLLTLRGKAIAGVLVYCLLNYFLLHKKKKLRLWHLVLLGVAALAAAGKQFVYYYVSLQGRSARSVLTKTAFEILWDYFPIGTGFGTYASHVAANPYSPVYAKYGFRQIFELGGEGPGFFDDTFWPIILGQTGAIGMVCYLVLMWLLYWQVLQVRRRNPAAYTAGNFMFLYLLISSTSEPAFNNSIAIPLALLLGKIIVRKRENCHEKMQRHRYCDLSMQCQM